MLKELNRTLRAPDVKTEIVDITPGTAAAWLETNINNRKRHRRFVSQFARDMAAGRWVLTGDSIKFDTKRNLIDGQHRLAACVEANVPFKSIVVYGLPRSAQDVLDTGKARSGSDVLSMRQMPNTTNVAGTLKLLINEKRGTSNVGGVSAITHSEMLAALSKHPDLPLYVSTPGSFPRGISHSQVSYIRYVAAKLIGADELSAAMINVLKTGVPDYPGDPIHQFRERIVKTYAERIGASTSREATFWTLKHCWNCFAKREKVDRLKWRTSDVAIVGLDLRKL